MNTIIKTSIQHRKQYQLPKVIPANLLGKRPDIASARAMTKAACHQVNVAKTSFYPNINLAGLIGLQSVLLNKFFTNESQNKLIAGAFDLPIFDAGARMANLSVKKGDYALAVNHYNAVLLSALQEVAEHLTRFKEVQQQLVAQNKVVRETMQNERLVQAHFDKGITDYMPVIEMKLQRLQQQSQQRQLRTYQQLELIALTKALAKGD